MEALAKENVELSMRLEQVRGQLSSVNKTLADTQHKLKNCQTQRDFNYTQAKALQDQFRTFVAASRDMESKLTGFAKDAEAGATALVKALEVDIVSRKEAAEERMAEERSQRSWWCWPC